MSSTQLSPEAKIKVLEKMKLLGRVWAGFFADAKYPPAIEELFAGSVYRAVYINLLKAELEDTEVDEDQLLIWFPDKDKRTKDKRRDELLAVGLLVETEKKVGGDKKRFYRLGDDLRSHLEAYVDYFADVTDLSDPRIQKALAA